MIDLQKATNFLKSHYCDDDLDADKIRLDCEHWECVAGDPDRFPNADLYYIDRFVNSAIDYLAMN